MAKMRSTKSHEDIIMPKEKGLYAIPNNWEWLLLENAAKWGSGGTPSRRNKDYYTGNIPWIKTGELNDGLVYDTEEKITEEAVQKSSAKLYPKDTVMIAMYGATIGKTGIMAVEASTNQACACAQCYSFLDYKYLFYYLQSQKKAFINKGKGGAQPNISQEIIKAFPIPIPPINEQKRIVSRIEYFISKLDGAIELIENISAESENRKMLLYEYALSGELTAKWRKDNNTDYSAWKKCCLKDICDINPKKIDAGEFDDKMEVSFVPMQALSEVTGSITDPQTRELEEVKNGYTNFREGDVVFAKITPCMENGKSAVIGKLVNDIGYGTTEFYVFRCSEFIDNKYLHMIFRNPNFRLKAKSKMTGAVGQQRVPKKYMENYIINLPPVNEQIEIVEKVGALIEKEVKVQELCESARDEIDEIRTSILTRAFHGDLDTNDLSEESIKYSLQECTT